MTTLWEPARHTAPGPPATDAELVAGITSIVEGLLRTRTDDGWPIHPNDLDGRPPPDRPHQSLYMGAAGVVWALHQLRDRCPADFDLAEAAHAIAKRYPGDGDPEAPSWFLGHSGVLSIAQALRWQPEHVEPLLSYIGGNVRNPTWETLWGSPGTMLAARMMGRMAPDAAPWKAAWDASAEALLSARDPDGRWTQDLYGRVRQLTGAGHGYTGNLQALFVGGEWLDAAVCAELLDQAAENLTAIAVTEGDGLNWAPAPEPPPGMAPKMLTQWCHGAPGIITSFRAAPAHDALDALLVRAGDTVWNAGPLSKGAGICHGTAGNGWAFLVLHERTGDALWFERARAFATVALSQVAEQRAETGVRASLFTGDPGVALFADAILRTDAGLPLLDV